MDSQKNNEANLSEIFLSLQGEGHYVGEPTVFVRLAGCNLLTHCSYCDTSYAQDPNSGTWKDIDSVVRDVLSLLPSKKSWICITGGEPLAQPVALEELIKEFRGEGLKIEIETNGTLHKPKWWTLANSWVADIKCPSSGVSSKIDTWFDSRPSDQVKFVVGGKEDLLFAERIIDAKKTSNVSVLLSPIFPTDDEFLKACWFFCERKGVRLSLQIHKLIWGNKRGV